MRTFQVKVKESSYQKLEQIAASLRRPTTWQAEELLEAAIAAYELVEVESGDLVPVRTLPKDERMKAVKVAKEG